MKRSEINHLIGEASRFFEQHRFHLPPFARWTAQQWQRVGREADEIRRCALGWDVTDFGSGVFASKGLVLFTIRNGPPGEPAAKTYCEKVMMVREDQVTPLHFHRSKMEDIINRGGGRLALRFYWAAPHEKLDESRPVDLSVDGVRRPVLPGEVLVLEPGESVTIPPRLYHDFFAVHGHGPVMAGEVSTVNDDQTDNRFFEPLGRFPKVEEDEPAAFLLCGDYP